MPFMLRKPAKPEFCNSKSRVNEKHYTTTRISNFNWRGIRVAYMVYPGYCLMPVNKNNTMKKLIFILILLPALASAQTITVSPTSIPAWGKMESTIKASIEYADFEAILLHPTEEAYGPVIECRRGKGCSRGKYSGSYVGLFYKPLSFEYDSFEADGGVGYFLRDFPVQNAERVNFTLNLTYSITKRIGVRYSHISNGFGLWNDMNPGIDHLSLTINLN